MPFVVVALREKALNTNTELIKNILEPKAEKKSHKHDKCTFELNNL